jgi:RNA polymerase sigma-70 factor (ECF subfamily)
MRDVDVIAEVLEGNTDAYGELVRRYYGVVFGICYHMVKNPDDAEDLAQEAFITAFQKLSQLENHDKFPGWLRRIAVNLCNRWLERKKRELSSLNEFSERFRADLRGAEREEKLQRALIKALDRLPEIYRVALTLFYSNGLGYAEIARFLDVPSSTVRGRLYKARKMLKEEVLRMVERGLKGQKPDENKFTEEVLREIVERAKKARSEGAHDELIKSCDEALRLLEELEETEDRRKLKMNILLWRGRSVWSWMQDLNEAKRNFEQALRIAEEVGDEATQVQMFKRIITIYLIQRDFNDALRWASRAYVSESCRTLAKAFDEALKLVEEREDVSIYLNRFRLDRTRAEIFVRYQWLGDYFHFHYEGDPLPPFPSFNSVYNLVFGPEVLLKFPIRLGESWSEEFQWWGSNLIGSREIESFSDTVLTGAGRFENCLRMRITAKLTSSEETWKAKTRSGTGFLWFAPGIGLVKGKFSNLHHEVVEIELADFSLSEKSEDYLPLALGNRWEYGWNVGHEGVCREVCLITSADREGYELASATCAFKPCFQRMLDFLSRRAKQAEETRDKGGLMRALFDISSCHFELGEVEMATQICEQAMKLAREIGDKRAEEKGYRILGWFYQESEERERWLSYRLKSIELSREIGDTWSEWANLDDLPRRFLLFKWYDEFDQALEFARKAFELAKEKLTSKEQADTKSVVNLLGEVLREPDRKAAVNLSCGVIGMGRTESFLVMNLSGVGDMSGEIVLPPVAPPVFHFYGILPILPTVGDSWGISWNKKAPHGVEEVMMRKSIESDSENVKVKAGEFSNCLKVRAEVRTSEREGPPDSERNGWRSRFDGERIEFYAPGIGLVKMEFNFIGGSKMNVELVDYSVSGESSDYLPLDEGNTWRYEWKEENGKLLFKEMEEVIGEENKTIYLASSFYALR